MHGAGAFGGRIDHVLSSLCTLHRHEGEKIILCGDGNLVRLLPCGHTDLEPDLDVEGPACGLVAMAAPATASSQGLKWTLGEIIRTSIAQTSLYVSCNTMQTIPSHWVTPAGISGVLGWVTHMQHRRSC